MPPFPSICARQGLNLRPALASHLLGPLAAALAAEVGRVEEELAAKASPLSFSPLYAAAA